MVMICMVPVLYIYLIDNVISAELTVSSFLSQYIYVTDYNKSVQFLLSAIVTWRVSHVEPNQKSFGGATTETKVIRRS